MNVPNKLTVSRFVLTGLFLIAFLTETKHGDTLALILFGAGSLTDYYDGMIARRDKLITNFGILMDPLADKILTCSAFIAFVGRGQIASWMVVIIVARELGITGLRLLAASKQKVLAAERYGKHKTISQIVAILSVLVLLSHPDWPYIGAFFAPWVKPFSVAAIWVSVSLTAVSGGLYLWRNRDIYLHDA